jgi:hypothetical protein
VHPPYRPRAEELYRCAEELLSPTDGVRALGRRRSAHRPREKLASLSVIGA